MPETDQTVKCPICEERFDPTKAGGWCTNPDCGEWQYEGDGVDPDTQGGSATHGEEAASANADDEQNPVDALKELAESQQESTAEAADSDRTSTAETPSAGDGPEESSEAAADGAAVEDTTADTATKGTAGGTEGTASDVGDAGSASNVGDEGTADEDATADSSGDSDVNAEPTDGTDTDAEPTDATDTDESATIECPDCGRELDADANFCVECGTDVQDVEPDSQTLSACPACGVSVDDEDASFCVNCGEDLEAHRSESGAEADSADSMASQADDTQSTDSDDTTETSDDAAAENAVEALASEPDAEPDAEPEVPDGLVLSIAGREIDVEDGDRIGREIRAALIDAGRPEDEAVRIHREHIRFVRESDGYYLVDLGDNPTRLNGKVLQKGDRERVTPGDELELSGVATVTIQAR